MQKYNPKIRQNLSREQVSDNAFRLISALEHLIESAANFHEITINKITRHAGISRSRFYNYFEDKNHLLRSCFEKVQAEIESPDSTWCLINRASTVSDLKTAIHAISLAYHEHKHLLLAIHDTATTDIKTREIMDNMVNRRIKRLRNHIKLGQREGWISGNLLAQETAMWLISTGFRTYEQTVSTGGYKLDEFIDQYSKYVWKVLYSAPPKA